MTKGHPENIGKLALLAAATTTATSSPVALPAGKKQFQIAQTNSTATATSSVQCSVDKTNWVTVYTQAVAAALGNNIFETDSDVPFWRGLVSAGAAGYSVDINASYRT